MLVLAGLYVLNLLLLVLLLTLVLRQPSPSRWLMGLALVELLLLALHTLLFAAAMLFF